MDKTAPGPWMMGGPSRTGKTTLVNVINEGGGSVAGFPVEGLFSVYLRRYFAIFSNHREKLIKEYLERPRYMDVAREVFQRPIDLYEQSISQLQQSVPDSITHQIALIHWLLQEYAHEKGKATWASFDLHPEFYFTIFRKYIPGLKLAYMVRDPREVLCALLFWRHYPSRCPQAIQRFRHGISMWCLSMYAALQLKNHYPEDVKFFSFNALTNGNIEMIDIVARSFGLDSKKLRSAFDFLPVFSYDSEKGFLAPDASRQDLLGKEELKEICQICWPVAGEYTQYFITPDRLSETKSVKNISLENIILKLGRWLPRKTRMLLDLIYYPGKFCRRRINSLRTLLRENLCP